MLIEFTVGNFLSFKEEKTFSMVGANPVKEHEGDLFENIFRAPKETKLLKSAIFYGANLAGKSNFLKAMLVYRKLILTSYNEQKPEDPIKGITPFLLNTATENEPSLFEMIFFIEEIRYRYGFEITKTSVSNEWLFMIDATGKKEKTLFTRTQTEGIKVSKSFSEGNVVEFQNATRDNSLFLSALAQFNGTISKKIQSWFKKNFIVVSGIDDDSLSQMANVTIHRYLYEPTFKKKISAFFRSLKVGFQEIVIEELDETIIQYEREIMASIGNNKNYPKDISDELAKKISEIFKLQKRMNDTSSRKTQNVSIEFKYNKLDDFGNIVSDVLLGWDLQSAGTQKLFQLLGVWFDVIENGKILVIDELDSSLHTLLTQELILFFHEKINRCGQLICAVHDTNLLKKEIFRRDQIWFAEKNDNTGVTDIYSLVEYKDVFVRNDASFEKGYLEGKYGAIPYLGDIQLFINDFLYEKETA